MRQFFHLFRIARVLARHDALFFLDGLPISPFALRAAKFTFGRKVKGREGQRLAAALQELGPTFIKFGQALSVRGDVIGDDIAADLRSLQDNVVPFPTAEAIAIIEEDFGKPINELFNHFEETPIAAASIAQVHFAQDNAGRDVAVKVLRPQVREIFKRDIAVLNFVAATVETTLPHLRRLKLRQVVEHFEQTVRIEMDLRMEAAAASELQQNMGSNAEMKIPMIYWDTTSSRVFTMERIEGIRIDDVGALRKAGHDADVVLQKASRIFFQQVFEDGFFHADMHPGNLFVGADGRIIAVDFGIMGRIDRRTQLFLAEMLKAFLDKDYHRVSEIHFEAGYIPAHQDKALFAQACRAIGEPVFGKAQKDISIALLMAQLFKVTEDFQMETQPQLILLQKTMMLAEGLGRILNPNVNFWELSKPLIEAWARENLGVKARAKDALTSLENTLNQLQNLPAIFTTDGIRIHPETVRMLRGERKRETPWRWMLWCVMVITLLSVFLQISRF